MKLFENAHINTNFGLFRYHSSFLNDKLYLRKILNSHLTTCKSMGSVYFLNNS